MTDDDLQEAVAQFSSFYKWILRFGVALLVLGSLCIVVSPWMMTGGGAVHVLAPLVVSFPLTWLLNRLALDVTSGSPVRDIPTASSVAMGSVMVAAGIGDMASVFFWRDSHSTVITCLTGTVLMVLGGLYVKWAVTFRQATAKASTRHTAEI